ncbi:hypothetical protein QFC20_000005 [Naganishia adeliensis]|uniref:Uncharacterized protein n=1 Tax=Naganishia adeliensis TaxID=92952 RepID=A0ACC2X1G7_9TREE|nr:hypothetical protein QFC20_000005 [Naganishia adeliensis]
MSSNTFPTIIRNARDEDYESIGRVYTAAFLDDPMTQLLSSQADGEDLFNWIWIEGAKAEVAKGHGDFFPKGFNITEWYKKEDPTQEWLHSLVEKYEEFLGKYLSFDHGAPAQLIVERHVLDVLEFAIAPEYQSQGFGKALMLRVIDYTKEQGLNVALTATSGKSRFYAKLGFEEVAPHIMLADGTVEGLVEVFLSASTTSQKKMPLKTFSKDK